MPALTITQIRFAKIPTPLGALLVRVNRNHPYWDLSTYSSNGYLEIRDRRGVVSVGDWKRRLQDEEGALVIDSLDVVVQDRLKVLGVITSNPTETVYDYGANGTTLLQHFFSDESASYTAWVGLERGGATEIFFSGNIDPTSIPKEWSQIRVPSSSDEQQLGRYTLKINPAQALREKTVQDFIGSNLNADGETAEANRYYNGLVVNPVGLSLAPDLKKDSAAIKKNLVEIGQYTYLAGTGIYESVPYTIDGSGNHYGLQRITLANVCKRVAAVCDMQWSASDFVPAFDFTEQLYNDVDDAYGESVLTDTDITINYNIAFGVTPLDGRDSDEWDNPIRWQRDAGLGEVLRDIAWQIGAYVQFDYHQTTGRMILKMRNRRESPGTFPAWPVVGGSSHEVAKRISKQYVEVSNRALKGSVRCPGFRKGDGISIELPFRTRPHGPRAGNPWFVNFFVVNGEWGDTNVVNQKNLEDGGADNGLNPDAWVYGAYLYRYRSGTTNLGYADDWNARLPGGASWTGCYALRSCRDGGASSTSITRENTLVGPAEFYARELLGDRTMFEREFKINLASGITALRDLRPNLEYTTSLNGSTVTFRAEELVINFERGVVKATFVEKPDYSSLQDLPIEVTGVEESSGGTGSTSASGSGGSYSGTATADEVLVVKAVATSNITLSTSTTTIDGQALSAGDIVLPTAQTDAKENTPYLIPASGAWTRLNTDPQTWRIVKVDKGTTYGGSVWTFTNAAGTVGTDNFTWKRLLKDGDALTGSGTASTVAGWSSSSVLNATRIVLNYNSGGGEFNAVQIPYVSGDETASISILFKVGNHTSSANDAHAVAGYSYGGYGVIGVSATTHGVAGTSNGSGAGGFFYNDGSGSSVSAHIDNNSNTSPVYYGITNGTGSLAELVGAKTFKVNNDAAIVGLRLISAAKTSGHTLAETDGILLIDTTSGSVTLTLPDPTGMAGRVWIVIDQKNKFSTNKFTIDPQTYDLNGLTQDKDFELSGAWITLTTDGTRYQMSVNYPRQNGGIVLLGRKTGIDGKTIANHTINPITDSGRKCVVTRMIVRTTTATAVTVAARCSLGVIGAAYTDIIGTTTLTGLTAVDKATVIQAAAAANLVGGGGNATFRISTGATATTLTLAVEIFGYYID